MYCGHPSGREMQMFNLFDNARPDPEAIARVKTWVAETFELPDDIMLSIAELRCSEHDCPPVETVITARGTDGEVKDWRIEIAIKDISMADVEALANCS